MGDSPLLHVNAAQVLHLSFSLARTGQMMPNVPVGGVRSSGFRGINVFCLAHKKYLLGIRCNTTYLW